MFHDVRMRGFKRRADVEDVVAWVDALADSSRTESLPLEAAAGRILTADLVSDVDVPAFARAAMDGWALCGRESFGASAMDPILMRVIGTSLPGRPHEGVVRPGQAVRIMTGAPLPDGADTVLRAEEGHQEAAELRVCAAVPPGRHVGQPGEDIVAGRTVLRAGRRLRPQDLGLASSVGHGTLEVRAKPRVHLLVTGDELLVPGSKPKGVNIVDANSPMLRALIERDGGCLESIVRVGDDEAAVRAALESAEGDILLVTGGSSVGQEDHAPHLLSALGELVFHGVAMRPAAPTGAGRLAGRPVFLLPGNPVSCLSAYDFFVGRLMRRLAGREDLAWPYRCQRGTLARKISSVLGRVDYVRVAVEPGGIAPIMARGASILSSTTEADGFVVVARDLEGWDVGAEVDVWLYS